MAKKTKAADLSIEEKLEQVLVVPGYEPYKIPDNWCWTTLEYAAKWGSGGTPSRKVSDYYLGDIPWVKTGELDNDYVYETEEHISEAAIRNSSAKLYPVNTVMIAMYGATIGKVGIMGVKATTNQACANAVCGKNVYYKYLFYYAISQKDSFISKGKGGAQPNISQEVIKKHEFPLPPLPEQHRIVERIESLFSKLDEAKEKAQEVIDSFETRKAAILHKAFSGELTAKWREENGVGIESWKLCQLSDLCRINPPKINTKQLSDDLEVSFFPMPALSAVYGEITEPQTRRLQEVKKGFTNFIEGDVVFAKITPCMENGKSAVIGKLVNNIGYGTTEFYVLRCSDNLINRYLYHLLRSKSFRDEAKSTMTGAVGQQRVPKSFIEEYHIMTPPIDEQKEIVSLLDSEINDLQHSNDIAESVIDQIDTMKKAVLARAFRGELGTNDPEEESAVELLKEILSGNNNEEEAQKPKRTRIVIPKEIDSLLKTELERKIIKLFLKSETGEVTAEEIMSVSSKKFDLIDAINSLKEKKLIKQLNNNLFILSR